MKWIPQIIRCILTLALVYGAYTETGIWTALNLLGIWIVIEVHVIMLKLKTKEVKLLENMIVSLKEFGKNIKKEVL